MLSWFSVMNSTSQKKSDFVKRKLNFIALNYLKQYATTSFSFEAHLNRKYYKSFKELCTKDAYESEVKILISKLVEQGYLNDARFLELKIASLFDRWKSVFYIKQHLLLKGFREQEIMDAIDEYYTKNEIDPEQLQLEQIQKIVTKKRLGQSSENYQKDLAKLVRLGYSYEQCRKALADSFS